MFHVSTYLPYTPENPQQVVFMSAFINALSLSLSHTHTIILLRLWIMSALILMRCICLDVVKLERKRHLGNDIVVLIFKEGNTPYIPNTITSEFNRISSLPFIFSLTLSLTHTHTLSFIHSLSRYCANSIGAEFF
jgi:hypothetical protein